MKKKKTGTLLMAVGILLMVGAIVLTVYNIWDSKRAEKASEKVLEELVFEIKQPAEDNESDTKKNDGPEKPDYITYPDMQMPTVKVEDRRYIGYIEIPAIGITLPVEGEEWDMEDLEKSPCLYAGSIYTDNAVIAGHNYTAHFGKLTNLQKGSTVRFTDALGNVFEYEVAWTETLDETDTEGMTEKDDWDLTLFTCNYAGDKRFTLRCVSIKE